MFVPLIGVIKKEDAHAGEYMAWIKQNVTIPSYSLFYNASQDSNLLSRTSLSQQYNFNGTLDIAIVYKEYAESGYVAGGIFVGIKVKKKVESRHDNQAILEMLLVNVASQYPVIVLLTDLRDAWRYHCVQTI